MKKLLYVLCIVTIFLLSSCDQNVHIENNVEEPSNIDNNTEEQNSHIDDHEEVPYIIMHAFYTPFSSAQALVEDADAVFIGRVTDISFEVIDLLTALPPTEETKDYNRRLHTIYDIDVEVSYKGDPEIQQFRQLGGIRDFRTAEQVSVLKKANAWEGGILVSENMVENIDIGETYLFAVAQFATGLPTLKNPAQSYFNMYNPFKKHTIGRHDDEVDDSYYAKTVDDNGSPIMSAQDVILVFGQDKWDTYWNQWKVDNPDWETWLNREAVEKALIK